MSYNRFPFSQESENFNKENKSYPADVLDKTNQGQLPINTQKSTLWTVKLWNDWAKVNNQIQNSEHFQRIPEIKELNSLNEKDLDSVLCHFLLDLNKQNGAPYPPKSLFTILSGIQRYMREHGNPALNFLYEKSAEGRYPKFQGALTVKLKELKAQGLGPEPIKQAREITQEQEKQLWDKGFMSLDTALGLSHAIFFYNSKAFGLRTGEEHRALRFSQFTVGCDKDGRFVRFHGERLYNKECKLNSMKNFKNVSQYEDPFNSRCYFNIFTLYRSKVPEYCKDFYYRPLSMREDPLSFSMNVLGQSTLEKYVKNMMKDAGFEGYYTNQSIKPTLCTELFCKGYNEQDVADRAGISLASVRKYKRTATITSEKHRMISMEFDPPPPVHNCDTTGQLSENLTESNTNRRKRKLFLPKKLAISVNDEFVKEIKTKKHSDIDKGPPEFISATDSITSENDRSSYPSYQSKSASYTKMSDQYECEAHTATNASDRLEIVQIVKIPKHSVPFQPAMNSSEHIEIEQQIDMSHQKDTVQLMSDHNETASLVTVPDRDDKTVLCSSCKNNVKDESTNFEINIGDLMRSGSNIPQKLSLKGIKTDRGSQLVIKIDFGEKKP